MPGTRLRRGGGVVGGGAKRDKRWIGLPRASLLISDIFEKKQVNGRDIGRAILDYSFNTVTG